MPEPMQINHEEDAASYERKVMAMAAIRHVIEQRGDEHATAYDIQCYECIVKLLDAAHQNKIAFEPVMPNVQGFEVDLQELRDSMAKLASRDKKPDIHEVTPAAAE